MNLKTQTVQTNYNGKVMLKLDTNGANTYLCTRCRNTNIIVLDAIEHQLDELCDYDVSYLKHKRSKVRIGADYCHDIIFSIYHYIEFLDKYNINFNYDVIIAIGNIPDLDNAFWNG